MMPQSTVDKLYFWARGIDGKAGSQWQEYEAIFKFPAPGDPDYRVQMKSIRIRFDVRQVKGTIWIDDVALHHAVPMNPWEAWQSLGLDRHSLVADPRFVNPAADDYRLQSASPAFGLGFKPIPLETIGPYRDDLRATWPIHEARGGAGADENRLVIRRDLYNSLWRRRLACLEKWRPRRLHHEHKGALANNLDKL